MTTEKKERHMNDGKVPVRLIVRTMRGIMEDPKATVKEKLLAATLVIRVTKRRCLTDGYYQYQVHSKQARNGLRELLDRVEGKKLN